MRLLRFFISSQISYFISFDQIFWQIFNFQGFHIFLFNLLILFIGTEPLDRESQDKYILIIEAYDNYHFGFTTGDSRHSFAQVIVSITDVNDQVPVFESEQESPHNCAIINEFHDIDEPILTGT